MAKEKSSFILYYDFEEQTATLTDEQVGAPDPSDAGL